MPGFILLEDISAREININQKVKCAHWLLQQSSWTLLLGYNDLHPFYFAPLKPINSVVHRLVVKLGACHIVNRHHMTTFRSHLLLGEPTMLVFFWGFFLR